MELPAFPDLSQNCLEAVLGEHGLKGSAISRLPNPGIFNAVFAVGDAIILRVPRDHPAFIEAAHKEALAVPAARAAGVRTPNLLAFDNTLTVLPVPYGLYERVRGKTIERLELEPMATRNAYLEVGRDLARLHQGVLRQGALAEFTVEPLPEPELWPVELTEQGYLGVLEADWLSDWIANLRRIVAEGVPAQPVFRHGDMQASNIMVETSLSYAALLDWGACGWGDAAHDFAGLPLAAVPFLLEGYRELCSLPEDGSFEAGIVLRQLQIALFLVRRSPQPDKSWAERPLGVLVDLLRVLGGSQDERFRRLLVP